MIPGPSPAPCILLVDDDRRIVELLEIAFSAHGFRVLTAADGEEAMKRTIAERPDLVVLDVRLPRKSGLEVCEWLRRDPDDPAVPVIMVSAVVDAETRLQAFTRGADDYVTKPFSPKELIARVKRMLARAAEARAARARQAELEREATRARDEVQRAHALAQRAQRLSDLALGPALDLLGVCDEDELASRLLPALQDRLGSGLVGLLLPGTEGGALVAAAVRGDGLDRLAGLELPLGDGLAALLAGLDRPVARHDLERFRDLAGEVAPFVAAGIALLVPLRGPAGLEGLIVLDERRDGRPFPALELESLAALSRGAAVALYNARRVRGLAERALTEVAERDADVAGRALAEAAWLAERAAHATLVPLRQRRLLVHAIRLGRGGRPEGRTWPLARVAAEDPSGFARDVMALRAAAADVPAHSAGTVADPVADSARAATLLAVALAYAAEREGGADGAGALPRALAAAGSRLDPVTRQAFEAAARERSLAVGQAA
jgi:DNA-binding response OmpR family regulator